MTPHDRISTGLVDVSIDEETPRVPPFEANRLDTIADSQRPAAIQRLLEAGTVAASVGAPNAGKTALAIDMNLHVAAGAPWSGLKVTQGPCIYFAAEAPGSVVMRAKACAARKFPGQTLPFYVVHDTPMLGDEQLSNLATERVISTIDEVARASGTAVRIAVFDTLASCLGNGPENSDGMVNLVAAAKRIATETGCAVFIIHHPSKSDVSGLRGHGSLAAACDTILAINVDESSGIRTATLTKSRDFATGLQIAYELEQVILDGCDQFGDPRSTIIVKPCTVKPAKKRPKGAAMEKLLAELERRHRSGETNWSLATVRAAAHWLGIHRNTVPGLPTKLRNGGFLRGPDSNLTLAYPPEDAQ